MTDRIDTAKEREKLVALEGHTPGPWRSALLDSDLNREAALRRGIIKEGEYFGYAVCPEPWEGLSVALMPACDADHSKDAELVAAAPDLLASNRRMLDALDAERAENERLREALAPFGGAAESAIGVVGKTTTLGVLGAIAVYFVTWRDFARARAALNPEGEA